MATIKLEAFPLTGEAWTEINTDYHGVRFVNHGAAVGCLYVDGLIKRAFRVVTNGAEIAEPFVISHVFHIDGWTHAVVERGPSYAYIGADMASGADVAVPGKGAAQQSVEEFKAEVAKVNERAAVEHARAVAEAQRLAEGLNLDGQPGKE